MTDEVASDYVACPQCGSLVALRELAEHLDACRQHEHPTRERFE